MDNEKRMEIDRMNRETLERNHFGENPNVGVDKAAGPDRTVIANRQFPGTSPWSPANSVRYHGLKIWDLQQEFDLNMKALEQDIRSSSELTRKGNSCLMLDRMKEVAHVISTMLYSAEKNAELSAFEAAKARKHVEELQQRIRDMEPQELDTERTEKAEKDLKAMPINELRNLIFSREHGPKDVKLQSFIIRHLLMRIEKTEQENLNLTTSGMSETEVESILSRTSILEKQVEVLGVERNCLNQVIRIFASQGKIDPAAEEAPGECRGE